MFTRALATTKVIPVEVITDKAAVYPHVLDELAPGTWHCTEAYAKNRIEADHGQLKRRLKTDHGARIIAAGHARLSRTSVAAITSSGFDEAVTLQVTAAFDAGPGDLTNPRINGLACLGLAQCNNAPWAIRRSGCRGRPRIRLHRPGLPIAFPR